MSIEHVTIVGLGLIGGSIAKALKKKGGVQLASLRVEEKLLDHVFPSWEKVMAWSDLIILATPLSTIPSLAQEIAACAPSKCTRVIDVGSVKGKIVSLFEELSKDTIEFLSTHPMAGSEKSGFENSTATLFENRPWAIIPHAKNRENTQNEIRSLIESMGGKPLILNAKEHDAQAALISHLPACISAALLDFVSLENPESLKLAGPGLESMTRLARNTSGLNQEINQENRKEILPLWDKWISYLQKRGPF